MLAFASRLPSHPSRQTCFYAAPDSQCMTKRTFIVPGDSVTVYKPYKNWYQVMYINSKTGEDFEGWVEEGRLRLGARWVGTATSDPCRRDVHWRMPGEQASEWSPLQ